jgi:hypothetical protein
VLGGRFAPEPGEQGGDDEVLFRAGPVAEGGAGTATFEEEGGRVRVEDRVVQLDAPVAGPDP